MNLESLYPFLIILALFGFAFFLEALVLYFFKVSGFWKTIGAVLLVNIISISIVYSVCVFVLAKIGYEPNVLNLQLPVVCFICWLSIIIDALLLQLLFRHSEKKKIYFGSICMNILSYLFLCFFISNSH